MSAHSTPKTHAALLIIDMQVGCFQTPRYDSDDIIARINQVSSAFRARHLPVIFIQHNGVKEAYLLPGTPDFAIMDTLDRDRHDHSVTKTVNDAFYRTTLKNQLDELNINTLYITGLATDFCVNATIHSALVQDYNLVVISDCHTTGDKLNLQARDIIEYHNFLWSNLTPTDGHILLQDHKEVLRSLV